MANFNPLQNYILFCIDKLVLKYQLQGPFLDVGCGRGDVSAHLAKKGWTGTAIDAAHEAIVVAQKTLQLFPFQVKVVKKCLFDEQRKFRTVFLLDVLEHIEEDEKALAHIYDLMEDAGYLVLLAPTHMREWRWDDDFYGHLRRYDTVEIRESLEKRGIEVKEIWDCTFPVFWGMRRLYTRVFQRQDPGSRSSSTARSAVLSSWPLGPWAGVLDRIIPMWKLVYLLQFHFFRTWRHRGHAVLVMGQKVEKRFEDGCCFDTRLQR